MAAWLRISSPFLSAVETASFVRLKASSLPRVSPALRPACFRSFAASATSKAGSAPKPAGSRPLTGIMKPRRVSPEMQKFLGGVTEVPRTQVLKEIWAYIKQNNLQDPANKKIIICDEKLKTIFAGKEQVGFLEVAGLIGPHFLKLQIPAIGYTPPDLWNQCSLLLCYASCSSSVGVKCNAIHCPLEW
ncbi:hypothetical protein V2J09_024119 [Rumex salicifolius]